MKCKITVLRRLFDQELVDLYSAENTKESPLSACTAFSDGQEFILEGSPSMPEGFCFWAWADIQRDVAAIMFGADYPWIKQKGTIIICCSDGLRPVVFKLERIE